MTLRSNTWLKNNFLNWDPDDWQRDLIDSLGSGDWQRNVTSWFVSSTDAFADDTNDGTDPDRPLATIDGAFGKALVAGDIVWVLPNHVEDLAAATIDMDLAGVFVVGVGSGESRPRIDFNNAASSVDIGANNITVSGLRFQPSITDVLIAVDIETAVVGTVIRDCHFMVGEDGAGVDDFVLSIDLKVACHDTRIIGNLFYTQAAAAGYTDAIKLTGASCRPIIADNRIQGTYTNAGITNDTTACDEMLIEHNVIKVGDGQPGITVMATTTGRITKNMIASTGVAPDAAIVAADCEWFENYAVDADGGAGVLIGVPADKASNYLGEDNANNAAATTLVVENIDGTVLERLEYLQVAQEVCVVKADGAVLAVADPLFDITGGPILVTGFFGIVTTIIGGAANCQIIEVVTEPAGTVNLSTDVAIDTDPAGTSYHMTIATPGVFTPTTAGAFDQVPAISWLCPIGQIQADTDGAQTGVIAWYLTYKPLSPDVVVAAAA